MHATQVIALLTLTSSALAAPWNWGNGFWHGGNNQGGNDNSDAVATEVAVVTAYTTVTLGGNWGQPTPAAKPYVPEFSAAPVSAKPTPAPQAPSTPSAPSSGSDSGYMGVVNEWRGKMGLSSLTQSSQLQQNAQKTVNDGNGEMVHELNSGSMAQVLAPGDASDFESVFVGGWLCEIPSLPGLDGICNSMSAGWSYGGETGHADILKSSSYSKIGCALADGIWGCDLA